MSVNILKLFFVVIIQLYLLSQIKGQEVPEREMRAVWIATVENIDWPSTPFLSVDQQKKEMTELLNLIKEYNLNTVVFQIRPAADAFYESHFEPWSFWLTGQQGKAPEPYYDPLEFTIAECRKRGLDIHVWLNPYRAVRDTSVKNISPDHITVRNPQWFITYGTTKYFNPGLPEVRNYFASIVSDIVKKYDIDAIHMDDYFYPYRIAGINFPDDSTFNLYHGSYGKLERDDWRRNNVDLIIQQVRDSIQSIKPFVQFGISPFGVWRNINKDTLGSATRAGQTNYDDLFADILKWQKCGWIDYVVPQLYWQIGFSVADYAVLANWWNNNTFGCPLYIGQAFYRLDKKSNVKSWRSSKEIIKQIELNRLFPNISGSMFFSAKYLRTNPVRLKQNLKRHVYQSVSLPPDNKRIISIIPQVPLNTLAKTEKDTIKLNWDKINDVKNYVIYKFPKKNEGKRSMPGTIVSVTNSNSFFMKKNRKTTLSRYYYMISSQSVTNTVSELGRFKE